MSNVFDTWIFRAIFPFGTAALCQPYPPSLLFPFLFRVSHAWASHTIPVLCVASKNTWSSVKEPVFTWYVTQPLCFLLHLLSHLTPEQNLLGIFNFLDLCGLCVCVFSTQHSLSKQLSYRSAASDTCSALWFVCSLRLMEKCLRPSPFPSLFGIQAIMHLWSSL